MRPFRAKCLVNTLKYINQGDLQSARSILPSTKRLLIKFYNYIYIYIYIKFLLFDKFKIAYKIYILLSNYM